MWTDETRLRHDRSGLRYTYDLTDEEWAEIKPLIPPAKPGGNKCTVNIREIVNGRKRPVTATLQRAGVMCRR